MSYSEDRVLFTRAARRTSSDVFTQAPRRESSDVFTQAPRAAGEAVIPTPSTQATDRDEPNEPTERDSSPRSGSESAYRPSPAVAEDEYRIQLEILVRPIDVMRLFNH